MSTEPVALDEPSSASQAIAPAQIPATRRLYWSLRRELWESPSIYLAPLAVAALILVGSLIAAIWLPEKMRAAAALGPMQQHEALAQPYLFAALLLMGTTFVVAVFYSLDALQGERRDRSILFWKSLPVSDLETVLTKASIPIVILPLLTFAITFVTQGIMLLLASAVLLASGQGVATLWTQVSFFPMSVMLLYHLVAVHALWYAPIFAWLLLVSAWARRVAFLWAVLPLFAIAIVEKIAFNSSRFGTMLANRIGGGAGGAALDPGGMMMDPLMGLELGKFLSSQGLWIGLALAAVFLAGAVRLRRERGPV